MGIDQEHNEDILDGGSVKVTMKMPSTGGQQENPKINARKPKDIKAAISMSAKNPKSLSQNY
jgi:hypothetical protein